MNPGIMRHKLTIYKTVREQNADGSPKCEEVAIYGCIWASRRCIGNPNSSQSSGGESNSSDVIFKIRATPELCKCLCRGLKILDKDCYCDLTYKLESWQPCERGYLELLAKIDS